MNDKVIAKPVILYIGKMPGLALPFYVFPIRKERHSGFLLPQLELGISEGEGRFVRNFGYYWAPSDYWDASVWADYYEQTKWIGHVETSYKRRYVLSGNVKASFMQELLYNKRRWDLRFSHRQELGRVWTAGASGDFRSDATYASDSNQTIQESVNRSLHSQLWVRGGGAATRSASRVDRQEQLDAGDHQRASPEGRGDRDEPARRRVPTVNCPVTRSGSRRSRSAGARGPSTTGTGPETRKWSTRASERPARFGEPASSWDG